MVLTGGADVAGSAAAALALADQRAPGGKRRTRFVRAAQGWLAQALKLRKPWSKPMQMTSAGLS